MDTHAIVVSDREGKIHLWSPGAEKLFGWSVSEALGCSLDLIVPESARERHWKAFHAALKAGSSRLHDAATELPVRCKDGSTRMFPARFLFLRDAHDRAVGAMALYAPPQA
jgi:PAS domain S-box-containing protein